MKRLIGVGVLLFLVGLVCPAWGFSVVPGDYSIDYGSSWDNPPENVEQVLTSLGGETQLMLVNGKSDDGDGGLESWFGSGAVSIILEEIAGYQNNTTFGWYDTNSANLGQIFTGADGSGAEAAVVFDDPISFGFYIDPNGDSSQRMYTEHLLNTHSDFQVAIFKILNTENQYILGWEDLDLNGGGGGDGDYQDMIVRVTINAVPEPSVALFLGIALVGVFWMVRKKATGC